MEMKIEPEDQTLPQQQQQQHEEKEEEEIDKPGWYFSIAPQDKSTVIRKRFEGLIDPHTGTMKLDGHVCGGGASEMHLVCVSDPSLMSTRMDDHKATVGPETDAEWIYDYGSVIELTLKGGEKIEGKVKDLSADSVAIEQNNAKIVVILKNEITRVSKQPMSGQTIFFFPTHHPSVMKAEPLIFDCYYSLADGLVYWEAGHTANYDRTGNHNTPLVLSLCVYIHNYTNFVYEDAVVSLCGFTSSFNSRPRRIPNKLSKLRSNIDETMSSAPSSSSPSHPLHSPTQVLSSHYRISDFLTIKPNTETKVCLLHQSIPPSQFHLKLFVPKSPEAVIEMGRVKTNELLGKSQLTFTPQTVIEIELPEAHSVPSFLFGSISLFEKYKSGGVTHMQSYTTSILLGCGNRVRIPLPYNTMSDESMEVVIRRGGFQKGSDFIKEEYRIIVENKESVEVLPVVVQCCAFRHHLWQIENPSHAANLSTIDPSLYEFEISVPLFQTEAINYSIRYIFSAKSHAHAHPAHPTPAPNVQGPLTSAAGSESPPQSARQKKEGGFLSAFFAGK